jgi:hypothetical protein
MSPYKNLSIYEEYDYYYYVYFLDSETHTSGDTVYGDVTTLYELFNYYIDYGYPIVAEFSVRNIYGQYTYYYYRDFYFDFSNPYFDYATFAGGEYTYGDNGYVYVAENQVNWHYDVYDNESNLYSKLMAFSAGITYTEESYDYSDNYYGIIYINLSNVAVNFDSSLYLQCYIYDIAGNSTSWYDYFYKIDSSRDIGISNFAVRGRNSNMDNYIGSQSLTGGNVAPIYTLSNTSYLSTKYMIFYVGLISTSSTASTYRLVYKTSTANITSTISSGTYINIASGYSGTSITVSTWYSTITEGSTRYAKIQFKNIYGRVSTSTVQVIFDYTAPTISTFDVMGNSSAESGYTNTRNVTYYIDASDTYLYSYEVGDDDIAEQMNYSTTKPTSGTMPQSYQGTHYFYLYVEDRAGNGNASYDTIIYDDIAPVVTIVSANTGTIGKNGHRYITANSVTYSVKYVENGSGARYLLGRTGCNSNVAFSTGTITGS